MSSRKEAAPMGRKARSGKSKRSKTKLGLPDLEQAKSAVIVSLRSPESQRSYRRSIGVRKIHDHPVFFAPLNVVETEMNQFPPAKTTPKQHSQHGTIAFSFQSERVRRLPKRACFRFFLASHRGQLAASASKQANHPFFILARTAYALVCGLKAETFELAQRLPCQIATIK